MTDQHDFCCGIDALKMQVDLAHGDQIRTLNTTVIEFPRFPHVQQYGLATLVQIVLEFSGEKWRIRGI